MALTSPTTSQFATRSPQRIGHKAGLRLWHGAIHVVLIPICILAMLPLLLIVTSSLTAEKTLALEGYRLWPSAWSLDAYRFLWREPQQLIASYSVSIFVTGVGASLSLLIMSLLAYAISRKDFALRHVVALYVFFTMLFNGGLVPYYILMTRTLELKNTVWALILPYLVIPFFVLLLRTYFAGLPRELLDAAKVDGASEWRIFFQIVAPLSTPALATVGLFSVLLYWNDLWQALLFIEDQRLYPLQFLLYKLIHDVQMLQELAVAQGMPVPHQSVRMAMAVVAIGPILFTFLFIQKYFIRGITLGGLKGE
jgi:putative aldouronate transport system permease protein